VSKSAEGPPNLGFSSSGTRDSNPRRRAEKRGFGWIGEGGGAAVAPMPVDKSRNGGERSDSGAVWDAVEEALVAALTVATAAGKWGCCGSARQGA
jgi:hypothetical protein